MTNAHDASEALEDFKVSVLNGEPLNESTYDFICETLHEISCREANADNIKFIEGFERKLKVKEIPPATPCQSCEGLVKALEELICLAEKDAKVNSQNFAEIMLEEFNGVKQALSEHQKNGERK